MEISELKRHKINLESDLNTAISIATEDFYKTTGLSVRHISVNFVNVSEMGGEEREIFTGVSVELDLKL